MSRFFLVGWLVVVWVALWGSLSAANVLSGLFVAAAVLLLFPVARDRPSHFVVRPVAILRFTGYFIWQLVASNITLTREVLSRRSRIRTGVIAVPMAGVSDGVLTFVANMLALTPGTMTIEVQRDPAVFYVHVLLLYDIDAVRSSITRLEHLAIEAFASPDAIAAVRRGDPP